MGESVSGRGRREFIWRACAFAVALPSLALFEGACGAQARRRVPEGPTVGGPCEGCEAIHAGMPRELDWRTTIAPASEPGERLEMSGRIFRRDGRTPAPGVVLYVYHTDARGIYPPAPGLTGEARRHGRLRGWVRTNAAGEYRFDTIRPAAYPGRRFAAHIHPIVKEPDLNEYHIDDYEFDDDPLLTPAERSRRQNRGGSGIVRLTRNAAGVWTGRRDITLGLNVAGYV